MEEKRPGPTAVLPNQMALPYHGEPPFEAGSDTSKAASAEVKPSASVLRQRVLAHFEKSAAYGSTCDEAETSLNMLHQTCSARVRELVLMTLIVDTKRRRKTRSGRNAAVYVVKAFAQEDSAQEDGT